MKYLPEPKVSLNLIALSAYFMPASVLKDTKSGIPGSDAVNAEIRLYDRLFSTEHPDAGGKDFLEALNPNSLQTITAYVEPSLAQAKPDDKFQFERHGYFVADRVDHGKDGKAVFNRVTGLKDSWGK
jgi:glutaminyl-tRNA synthetase